MPAIEVAFKSTEPHTLNDFLEFLKRLRPGDVNRYELIHGRIVMTPPASSEHGRGGSRITSRLSRFVFEHNWGECFDSSAGFLLPSGDLVQPDFAFVSKERFEAVARSEGEFERAVPNLVVEILSPATAKIDRSEKKAIYETNGVEEYWMVDRRKRQIVVYRLTDANYDAGTVFSPDQNVTSTVLRDFSCPVRELLP